MSRVNKKYTAWIKTQKCCNPNCKGSHCQIVPAHQRILGRGGIGLKPPDSDALPLCQLCHLEEHKGSVTFWDKGNKADTKVFVQGLCDKYNKMFEV